MKLNLDSTKLAIYHEGRKRRVFVAELQYNKEKDLFELTYDKKYVQSKQAIPIGPDLDLFKKKHISSKGKLFASLADRIPSRANPAYEEYCKSQGISSSEKNPIILLGFIGRRGPSSFVFEPVYKSEFSNVDILRFRKTLKITRHDLAQAFEFSVPTIQRIETGKSKDENTLKRLQIYLEFPEVALWQLKLTGAKVHGAVLDKLIKYFEEKIMTDGREVPRILRYAQH
jgi:transcriptional regulator with XRE-family HTH domain